MQKKHGMEKLTYIENKKVKFVRLFIMSNMVHTSYNQIGVSSTFKLKYAYINHYIFEIAQLSLAYLILYLLTVLYNIQKY